MTIRLTIQNELELTAATLLKQLCEDRFASRLFSRDDTLWGEAAQDEASQLSLIHI